MSFTETLVPIAGQIAAIEDTQSELSLLELSHEIALAGTLQTEAVFGGIIQEMRRAEFSQQERIQILSDRVTQVETGTIALESQLAANEQLRQQEKLTTSQQIARLQAKVENVLASIDQLSNRLAIEENNSAQYAVTSLQQQQEIVALKAQKNFLQQMSEGMSGQLNPMRQTIEKTLALAHSVNGEVAKVNGKIDLLTDRYNGHTHVRSYSYPSNSTTSTQGPNK
jgi:hypothetical protein